MTVTLTMEPITMTMYRFLVSVEVASVAELAEANLCCGCRWW